MAAMWDHLLKRLRRMHPNLEFLRVVEPHASGRRWHLHVLLNVFVHVDAMRRMGQPLGWGRCHVARVREVSEGVPLYLSKYVAKARKTGERGIRLYSCSLRPKSFSKCRVSDVEHTVDGKTHKERWGWLARSPLTRGQRAASRCLAAAIWSARGQQMLTLRDWYLQQYRLAIEAGDELDAWTWKEAMEHPEARRSLWEPTGRDATIGWEVVR